MEHPTTLSALRDRIRAIPINEFYEEVKYDYEASGTFDRVEHEPPTTDFVRSLAWTTLPTLETVRRLFNQINTDYAERWGLEHLQSDPIQFLIESNRLLLWRQGKGLGFRGRRMEYGYRAHLDFLDPRRRMKWLAGVSPTRITAVMQTWATAVDGCTPSRDNALALAMFIIAIHPFVDANGRSARLTYTWLCERWELKGKNWLDEGPDGELKRTGTGLASTEYLMAQFMISVGNGANVISPAGGGTHDASNDERMSVSLEDHLLSLTSRSTEVVRLPAFVELSTHLRSHGHFRSTSPRFECLRSVLA